jgi:hypothetical protein
METMKVAFLYKSIVYSVLHIIVLTKYYLGIMSVVKKMP